MPSYGLPLIIGAMTPTGARTISGMSLGRLNLKFSMRSVTMACISMTLWGK